MVSATCEWNHPTWEIISEAIRSLKSDCLLLELLNDPDCNLSIDAGDGHDDMFIVQAISSDGLIRYLIDPLLPVGETRRVVGGQMIPWPRRAVANLASALRAASTFVSHGDLDSGLCWKVLG